MLSFSLDYTLLWEAPLSDEQFTADTSAFSSPFYKVVLEAPHNTVNQWIMVENGQ